MLQYCHTSVVGKPMMDRSPSSLAFTLSQASSFTRSNSRSLFNFEEVEHNAAVVNKEDYFQESAFLTMDEEVVLMSDAEPGVLYVDDNVEHILSVETGTLLMPTSVYTRFHAFTIIFFASVTIVDLVQIISKSESSRLLWS
jgi:hypothetical protein